MNITTKTNNNKLSNMKSYNHISLLALLFCVMLSHKSFSQQDNIVEPFLGSWTLDFNSTFSKRERQMKAIMDTMPQNLRVTIENNYRGRTMSFGPKGDFRQYFPDGRNVHGTWTLDQKNMSLILTDPSGKAYIQRIQQLTDRALVLRLEETGQSRLFVKELYFIKN
jgi:hypothetical protein